MTIEPSDRSHGDGLQGLDQSIHGVEGVAGWNGSSADESFHAASTMKVAVLIELFHQRQQGKLTLDDPLRVKNEFRSLADDSIDTLDPGDDSETDLYKAVGQTRTLAQLCELMS